ncbi:MAG: hypothetical protein Q8K32_29185 [Archangium sp.]|nr:hypothetical protein [Archangium sp.]
MRTPFTALKSTGLRWLAVLLLCVAAPSVQDIIADVANWTDGDCCSDECEESGAPCTQQCMHCVCGPRVVAATSQSFIMLLPEFQVSTGTTRTLELQLSGHRDPPFRPPVS